MALGDGGDGLALAVARAWARAIGGELEALATGSSDCWILRLSIPTHIHVGHRRREKLGPIGGLKASLERVGQIHPITVRMNGSGYELVAGERRLKAFKSLGWKRIRARVGSFTDEELRDIEFDENAVRLDLIPFEVSKARLRQIEAAEREIEEERISAQDAQKTDEISNFR